MADRIFRYPAPEDSPGFLLWQVSNHWQRAQRAALKPFALTHGQFVLLANLKWLQDRLEVITQNDLAHHAGIDVMMTSDLVRKLEERGLIRRTEHPHDSRARSIRLTAPPAQDAPVISRAGRECPASREPSDRAPYSQGFTPSCLPRS